jgi:hypothetical protein
MKRVLLGEPNSSYVNKLYPVVNGFSAVLLASDSNTNTSVSQRLRVLASVGAILWFGIGDYGDQAQPLGFRPYPAFSPSEFSHSQVNRGSWLTGCCGRRAGWNAVRENWFARGQIATPLDNRSSSHLFMPLRQTRLVVRED